MNSLDKLRMQTNIDKAYIQCDSLKDEIAVLQDRYNKTLKYIELSCRESGLLVSQSIVDMCNGD